MKKAVLASLVSLFLFFATAGFAGDGIYEKDFSYIGEFKLIKVCGQSAINISKKCNCSILLFPNEKLIYVLELPKEVDI